MIPGLTGNLILKRCPVKPGMTGELGVTGMSVSGMTVCRDEGILDVEHDAIAGA